MEGRGQGLSLGGAHGTRDETDEGREAAEAWEATLTNDM